MNETTKAPVESAFYPCPIRNILSRIGDKWSMLVVMALRCHGVLRFNRIQKELPDISQRMLTVTLRTLEADGLVSRTVYPEVPPRVEYRLTERGESLVPHLEGLVGWAAEHMEEIRLSRQEAGAEKIFPGKSHSI